MRRRHLLIVLAATAAFFMAGLHDGDARLVLTHCSQQYLHRGDRGACVKAAAWLLQGHEPMRRSLRTHKYFHVRHTSLTSHFGKRMARQTRGMKYRLGYTRNEINGVWGPNVWAYVVGSKLRPLSMRIRAGKRYQHHLHPRPRVRPSSARVARMLALARAAIAHNYANSGRYYYTQGGNRSNFYNGITNWPEGGDCSGSILGLEHLAGVPATGGTYFGYTGTIANGRVVWRRGQSVSRLRPGDLIVYGWRWPYDHVAMLLNRALRVYSFGSTNCPCNLPAFYRFDAALAVRP